MSDLPHIESNQTDKKKLRLAAMILSGVIGLFVAYWIVYGLHTLVEVFAPAVAHSTWSWFFSGLAGIGMGGLTVFRVYAELSRYVEL